MTDNNIAKSEKYLAIAQAIHAELEKYIEQGDVAQFGGCAAIFEFTDLDARKAFALEIKRIACEKGSEFGFSENAQQFLTEHFQLKIASNNLSKCMFEQLCFSPIGIIPTALNYLIFSHLAHGYVDVEPRLIEFPTKYKFYVEAINELVDQPLPDHLLKSMILSQSNDRSNFNESLFAQFIQLHKVKHNTPEYDHTFLWVKPERIMTNPIESEMQVRVEFSKIYGELLSYILKGKQFQDCSDKLFNLFGNGSTSGVLHNTMASFIQYPLSIFMSASDHASMAQRLGEGFFGLIFAIFSPSFTLVDTPSNYQVHMVPVISLDEVSKKVSLTYLAGVMDWYRSLCFSSGYFNRLNAFACFEYHENFIKSIYPKGFKTVVNVKPLEFKEMVWKAYERGIDLGNKRSKKFESMQSGMSYKSDAEAHKEPLKS